MAGIRPLTPGDLPQVADICEVVLREGKGPAKPGLAKAFQRMLFDSPWWDPEIPSLVYEETDGRIVATILGYVRRMVFDGKRIRMVCGGQFMSLPESRGKATGAFLMQKFLNGPQDLTITDGATPTTLRIWERMKGRVEFVQSMRFTRILRPARFMGRLLANRRRGLRPLFAVAGPLLAACDWAGSRLPPARRPSFPYAPPQELTPAMLVEDLPRIASRARLRPDYDLPYVTHLYERLAEMESRGALHKCAVTGRDGRIEGCYIYQLLPGDVAHVVQLVATDDARDRILDHLCEHAWRQGALAIQGRAEEQFMEGLQRHRCLFHYQEPFTLIHSKRDEILKAIYGGESCLTRLEGHWWMGFHREKYE
jgi:hypothetical protein